jgi:hypothetical protein
MTRKGQKAIYKQTLINDQRAEGGRMKAEKNKDMDLTAFCSLPTAFW